MLHLLLSKRVKCLICSTTSAARSFLKTNVMWKRSGLLRCQHEEIKEEMLDDNVQTASVVWCWILITSLDIKLWFGFFFFFLGGADYARTTQLPRAFSHPRIKGRIWSSELGFRTGIIQHNRLDKGAKNLQSVSRSSQNDSMSLFTRPALTGVLFKMTWPLPLKITHENSGHISIQRIT